MTHRTLHRSLAALLGRHARRALPPARASWADGIQYETEHVQGDWQALRWASGCVLAAYRERFRAMRLMELGAGRFLVTSIFAVMAIRDFFATALTIAYRTDALGIATRLGRATAGDDFRRFIPLMDAVPYWLHAMWVCAGVLYLMAIADIALHTRRVHVLVAAAVALDLMAEVLSHPIIAATGVAVTPGRSLTVQAVPFVLPLVLALVLWAMDRRVHASKVASP
jgi:hypothetical protein